MSAPYDPRAAALDALAIVRYPDVSDPTVEQVEAMESLLRAMHQLGAAGLKQSMAFCETAYLYGCSGRPIVPPR